MSPTQPSFGGGASRGSRMSLDDQLQPVGKGISSALGSFGSRVLGEAKTTGHELKHTFRPISPRSKLTSSGAPRSLGSQYRNRAAETLTYRPRAAGVIGGTALAGTFGAGAMSKSSVDKRRREYEPEHRRQRRLGMYEAALVGGGGSAVGYGGHRIVTETKAMRKINASNGMNAKMSPIGSNAATSGAVRLRRMPALALVGGLAAVGGAGAVRHHAETSRGRPRG